MDKRPNVVPFMFTKRWWIPPCNEDGEPIKFVGHGTMRKRKTAALWKHLYRRMERKRLKQAVRTGVDPEVRFQRKGPNYGWY